MKLQRLAGSLAALAALSAAVLLYTAHPIRGSDHQDSPTLVAHPGADITDVYVFPSAHNANAVDLVMNVHPLIPAGMSGSVSFDPGVLYQFKIVHGPVGTTNPEDMVFQLQANTAGPGQTLTLYGPYAPKVAGAESVIAVKPSGSFAFNRTRGTVLPNGIVAFAGPRADPFFFDLFQFFTVLPDRLYSNPRTGDKLGSSTPTFNGFAAGSTSGPHGTGYACSTAPSTNALTQINGGFNVLSIVLEVPRALLAPRGRSPIVHVWTTTSLPTTTRIGGLLAYQQIELLSRPAVKELFETFQNHSFTNAASPYADPVISNSIGHFMRDVAGRSPAITKVVRTVLYPNELAAEVSQPGSAAYLGVETGGATGSKFGGRGLTDDIIDISLGAVFGSTIPILTGVPDDGAENNCLTNEHVSSGQGGKQTQATFPYLAPPH